MLRNSSLAKFILPFQTVHCFLWLLADWMRSHFLFCSLLGSARTSHSLCLSPQSAASIRGRTSEKSSMFLLKWPYTIYVKQALSDWGSIPDQELNPDHICSNKLSYFKHYDFKYTLCYDGWGSGSSGGQGCRLLAWGSEDPGLSPAVGALPHPILT